MALPDLIEIVPLEKPVRAEITVPGSKSITNRALILAALADGEVMLNGALWSEDTEIMFDCLQKLGFQVSKQNDPAELCNRTLTVVGQGGRVPPGGAEAQPLDLFVGNAGTAARFLAPFLCLGSGVYRLHGVARMHERPQAALFSALRELGYRVESENGNDKLPVKIWGEAESENRKAETSCKVSIAESSQFASALLLSSKVGGWNIEIVGENADESPYVAMTSKLMTAFPKTGGTFQIEPDASSGSYFWGAGWLLFKGFLEGDVTKFLEEVEQKLQQVKEGKTISNPMLENQVMVSGWPDSHWQIDADFTVFIRSGLGGIPIEISRLRDLGDSIMTAIVLAPFSIQPVKFTELGRLRVQECERVVALRTELTKCGAKVIEEGDTLTVYPAQPGELHGAEIETYNDHRMAMCFAILGLKIPGIKIRNPACVKKTFPNFLQKLAAAPPHGLGAEIWEVKNGRRARQLCGDDLFGD
jgi:3-phosphoshikimate 1-carboxyvinyltransferase